MAFLDVNRCEEKEKKRKVKLGEGGGIYRVRPLECLVWLSTVGGECVVVVNEEWVGMGDGGGREVEGR